jgi:predicted nucleic acid-binding protein
MRILVDTNVVLDVLLERHPFYDDCFAVFQIVDLECVRGCLSAASITDIFYFIRKKWRDIEEVYRMMDKLTEIFSVVPVSEKTIAGALALRWKDFEDAVQYTAATENDINFIVTRNAADYELSGVPCMAPIDFIAYFDEKETK